MIPSGFKNLFRWVLFPCLFLVLATRIDGDVYLNLLNTPWQFANINEWDQRTCSFDVVNATNLLRKVEGLRFTVPGKPTTFVSYDNPSVDVTGVNDGNGPDRYTARISGMNTNGTAFLNAIKANTSLRINLTCSGIQAGTDFTPVKHQYLVKTGSISGDKGYKDAPPISVDIIDSLIALPWFYDIDLYIPDSLGIQGGTYTGGFIDTWYDQAGDSSLWQIQIGLPADYFTVNGQSARYRPDLMGQNDASGAGPLYAMSLAIAQEYMNADLQIFAGCAPNESYGGVEMFTDMGGFLVSEGCKYIADKGGSGGTGPCNMENAPYTENVYVSYPKFLPYATNPGNPDEFCVTPGTGASCLGNSPQMANALLISALYMWNTYDRMVNATDFWAKDLFNKAADRKITAKMVLSGWNKGNDYPYEDVMEYTPQNPANNTYNDVIQSVSSMADVTNQMAADYLNKIYPALNPMLAACVNSENNGGNCKIHDDSISLDHVEQLFFGMSGNGLTPDPDNGVLGAGGILWHFNMSETKRAQLWSDVKTAFNKLKGKAPSTQGTELISLRYDLLVVLRVAKQYLSLERPKPTDQYFTGWVDAHSTKTPVTPINPETVYPHLLIAEKGMTAQNDFFLKLVIADNGNLDVDKAEVVEWILDSLWESWYPGEYVSGDTNNAVYKVTISAQTIADYFNGKDGYGWVRVTDRCGNSTIEKFTIEGVPYPTVSEAYIEDTEGEGFGTKITVKMTLGTADTADELNDYTRFQYAWPAQTPLQNADPNNTTSDIVNNIITVTDNSVTSGAGLGLVSFDYPSKDSIEGNMLDRVGPAIIKENGAYLYSGAKDTLEITLTEDITENLQVNTKYLRFKIGNGTPEEIASDEVLKVSSSKWRFTFAAGTLADKDSVNLIEGSGLQDLVGNGPADYNKYRPIKKIGGKEPRWDIGYIQDTSGDGFGDRITVTIIPGSAPDADKPSDVIKYEYSWPDKNNFTEAPVNTLAISGNSLTTTDNTITNGAGEGNARLEFPSATITGNVIDSVGPALTVAILSDKENASDPDSLTVTFTEPITENLISNHQYLNINGTTATSLTATKVDNASLVWLFTFAANTLKDGDKVSLISTSGLIDQAFPNDNAHNPPLPNNKEVTVILIKNIYKVTELLYLDTDAEGTLDSVVVTVNKNIAQEDLSNITLLFFWPQAAGNTVAMTAYGSDFSLFSGVKLGWRVTGYTPKQYVTSLGTTWGSAAIIQPNIKTGKIDTTVITDECKDGMAPVIVSADYLYFNSSMIDDTLNVSFSEEMGVVNTTQPFKFRSAAHPSYLIDLNEVTTVSNVITFSVTSFTDNVVPANGDSIWIYAGHGVQDNVGIEQKVPDNIKQSLSVYSAYSILSAVYYDTDLRPDGLIDLVSVTMNAMPDTIDFTALASAVQLPVYRSFNALAPGDFTATANGFNLAVTQSGVEAYTAVDNRDILAITQNCIISSAGMLVAGQTSVFDSLAPVITKAVFYPAFKQDNQDVPDTLAVTFSETIKSPSTVSTAWPRPFLYCHADAQLYTMDLRLLTIGDGKAIVFTVTGKNDYPEISGDSIRIAKEALITDNLSIVQSKDTKPLPLIVRKYKYAYNVQVFPNPYTPGETDKNVLLNIEKAWQYYSIDINKKGVLILVKPYGYINKQVTVSITAQVFDVVGNTVMIKEEDAFTYTNDETKQAWYVIWDTKNEQGRFIARGNYLCVVTVKDHQEGSSVVKNDYPVMFGVKK